MQRFTCGMTPTLTFRKRQNSACEENTRCASDWAVRGWTGEAQGILRALEILGLIL